MAQEPRLDIIRAALGDPSRARMLCELMDGQAYTSKELAAAAGVSPQTASVHLDRLAHNGLTSSLRSGRHHYHRICGRKVAHALETLAGLLPTDHLHRTGLRRARQPDALIARCCYDHIAGRLGVLIAQRWLDNGTLRREGGGAVVTPGGIETLRRLGLRAASLDRGRPPRVSICLDWSERRMHLSGPLGVLLLRHAFSDGWLERRHGSRTLLVTTRG